MHLSVEEMAQIVSGSGYNISINIDDSMTEYLSSVGVIFIISGVVLGLMAIFGILMNAFGFGRFHRFIKSVRVAGETDTFSFKVSAVSGWLIFFGIVNAISAIGGGILLVVSGGCQAAALILSAVLVNTYFSKYK